MLANVINKVIIVQLLIQKMEACKHVALRKRKFHKAYLIL